MHVYMPQALQQEGKRQESQSFQITFHFPNDSLPTFYYFPNSQGGAEIWIAASFTKDCLVQHTSWMCTKKSKGLTCRMKPKEGILETSCSGPLSPLGVRLASLFPARSNPKCLWECVEMSEIPGNCIRLMSPNIAKDSLKAVQTMEWSWETNLLPQTTVWNDLGRKLKWKIVAMTRNDRR